MRIVHLIPILGLLPHLVPVATLIFHGSPLQGLPHLQSSEGIHFGFFQHWKSHSNRILKFTNSISLHFPTPSWFHYLHPWPCLHYMIHHFNYFVHILEVFISLILPSFHLTWINPSCEKPPILTLLVTPR